MKYVNILMQSIFELYYLLVVSRTLLYQSRAKQANKIVDHVLLVNIFIGSSVEQSIQKLYQLGENMGDITVVAEIERFLQLLRIQAEMFR